MGEGVRHRAKTRNLGNRRNILTRNSEVDRISELTGHICRALSTLNTARDLNDRGLVSRDRREVDRDLLRGARNCGACAKGAVRRVLALTLTLGSGRINDDEGVLLDVVGHCRAVKGPVLTCRNLVNNRSSGHGLLPGGEDDTPHDGLILVTVLTVVQSEPAFLGIARLTSRLHDHIERACQYLVADLNLEVLLRGSGIANHCARRDGTGPLRSRVGILVKDNGDNAVGSPRTASDDDTVCRANVEGAFSGGSQDRLAATGLGDGRVVGEEVTGLDGPLRLPRKLHSEIPQISNRLGLTPLGVDQLHVVPVEINLVIDVRRRGGACECRSGRSAGRR